MDIRNPFLLRRRPATVGAYGWKIHFTRNSIHFLRAETQAQRIEKRTLIGCTLVGIHLAVSKVGRAFRYSASRAGAQMNHHQGPTVQPRADRVHDRRDDANAWRGHGEGVHPLGADCFGDFTKTPKAVVPIAHCRFAFPAYLCAGKRSRPAASGAGSPTQIGRVTAQNSPEEQVRKGRPKRALSTLIPRVSGRSLDRMTAHTREQHADLLRTATGPVSGPLWTPKHLARRYVPLSAGFSQTRRQLGSRVPCDCGRPSRTIGTDSSGLPPSCVKKPIACMRAEGADGRPKRIERHHVR